MKKFLLNSCVSVIALVGGMGILTPSVAMENEEEKNSVPLNILQPRVNTDPNNDNGYLKAGDAQFPLLVMQRIVYFLDIDTQVTAREVCHLWNFLGLEAPGGKLTLFAHGNYESMVLGSVGEHIPFLLRPGAFHVLVADGLSFAELLPQAIEPVRASPETQAFLRDIVAQAPVTPENFADKTKTHEDHPQLQRYLGALRLLAESGDQPARDSLNSLPWLSYEDLEDPVAQNVMWCGYFDRSAMWVITAHFRNEKPDNSLVERFLLTAFKNNIKDLELYKGLLSKISQFRYPSPQAEERKKLRIEIAENIIVDFLQRFPEEGREETQCFLSDAVNVFISLCCDQGEYEKIEAFLKRYEKDVDLHSFLLRVAVTVYCEKNDLERAHSVLVSTKFRNLAVWKGYATGLWTHLKNKSRSFDEQYAEDHLRLFIENFPEKENKSVHHGLLKFVIALYAEKDRFQNIDLILKKYAGDGIKYRLGLIQSKKSSRDNPTVRAYVLQKLEELLKEVKGKPSEYEVGRRYIKNILKAPYDKDLFLQGETYLDTLLEKVKEMDSSSLEALEEFEDLSSSTTSDDSYTYTYTSSNESSSEEEEEAEVVLEDESPRDSDYMREELDIYKACFSLYQEATEEKAVAILEKGDKAHYVSYLMQPLKHRGVSSLKVTTREALRDYILKAHKRYSEEPLYENYLFEFWKKLLLSHTKIIKELLKGAELTPEDKEIADEIEEILDLS